MPRHMPLETAKREPTQTKSEKYFRFLPAGQIVVTNPNVDSVTRANDAGIAIKLAFELNIGVN